MKRKYIYMIVCSLSLGIIFSLGFFWSSRKSLEKVEMEDQVSPPPVSQKADNNPTDRTNSETEYVLEEYFLEGDQVKKSVGRIPAEYAGVTREECIRYLNSYEKKMPLKESLEGMISIELISFSKNQLVIRKTYQDMSKNHRYFLILEENEVVVYYSDKKTTFMHSGIMKEAISEETLPKLALGYYVKTEEELYSILEGLSS